ncbi:hypothetical protein [Nitrosomonas sp.]|uniref:hypothetical protein n=1 Tax=Nitrosomonas sp. TaxID=42353 RepID=UPI001DF92A5E|nr:hypothetical protein [Nitrosomonas sp.]MBX3617890.1 hypothetical protein [Nitrosomonas sp.]
MTTITFLVNGNTAADKQSKVRVDVTERQDGSLFFEVKQHGFSINQLYGVYFDVTDKSLLNTLRVNEDSNIKYVSSESAAATGTHGTDHAVTRNGIGHSFIRTYNFILTSVQRRLTLADFANIKLDCANDNTAFQDDEDSHRWLYMSLA